MSFQEMKHSNRVFIYLDVESGEERKILVQLMNHDEVLEGHLITGQFDILAVLEVERAILETPQEKVLQIVEKIRKLRGVKDTNTVMPAFSVTKR